MTAAMEARMAQKDAYLTLPFLLGSTASSSLAEAMVNGYSLVNGRRIECPVFAEVAYRSGWIYRQSSSVISLIYDHFGPLF
jgi:hypothetical protein